MTKKNFEREMNLGNLDMGRKIVEYKKLNEEPGIQIFRKMLNEKMMPIRVKDNQLYRNKTNGKLEIMRIISGAHFQTSQDSNFY